MFTFADYVRVREFKLSWHCASPVHLQCGVKERSLIKLRESSAWLRLAGA